MAVHERPYAIFGTVACEPRLELRVGAGWGWCWFALDPRGVYLLKLLDYGIAKHANAAFIKRLFARGIELQNLWRPYGGADRPIICYDRATSGHALFSSGVLNYNTETLGTPEPDPDRYPVYMTELDMSTWPKDFPAQVFEAAEAINSGTFLKFALPAGRLLTDSRILYDLRNCRLRDDKPAPLLAAYIYGVLAAAANDQRLLRALPMGTIRLACGLHFIDSEEVVIPANDSGFADVQLSCGEHMVNGELVTVLPASEPDEERIG